MVITLALTAARALYETMRPYPHALFKELLSEAGGPVVVRRLLSSTSGQLTHAGPAGFTTLHAAVVGGWAGALPGLAAQLVAAGVEVDSVLDAEDDVQRDALLLFANSFKLRLSQPIRMKTGDTALAVAARCASLQATMPCLLPSTAWHPHDVPCPGQQCHKRYVTLPTPPPAAAWATSLLCGCCWSWVPTPMQVAAEECWRTWRRWTLSRAAKLLSFCCSMAQIAFCRGWCTATW
jgi:hypothetical protein